MATKFDTKYYNSIDLQDPSVLYGFFGVELLSDTNPDINLKDLNEQ